jgi:hypothetical protein
MIQGPSRILHGCVQIHVKAYFIQSSLFEFRTIEERLKKSLSTMFLSD